MKLELGCGNNAREMPDYENICIDVIKTPIVTLVSNLGFDSSWTYKYENSVDLVNCYDFLEHIPKQVYLPQYQWNEEKSEWDFFNNVSFKTIYPFVTLMNDIWKVLKHKGILYIETPNSEQAYLRDPTHCNRITEDVWHYFQKDDNLYFSTGLIKCNFELVKNEFRKYKWTDKDIMCTTLKAIKEDTKSEKVLI